MQILQLDVLGTPRAWISPEDAVGFWSTEDQQLNLLCELNVMEQVVNVSQTTVVREAWARGQSLAVHGWVYDLMDGLIRDLDMCVTGSGELPASAQAARAGRAE